MKKWFVVLTSILVATLAAPQQTQAGIYIEKNDLPVITEMTGTGFTIDQKIESDVLTLTFDIVNKADISNFGFGLKFNPNEYKLERVDSGFIINPTNPGDVSIGSLFTLKNVPTTTVVTLRKRGAAWGVITPQELNLFTGNRHNRRLLAFEPAPAFAPVPRPTALTLNNFPNPFNPETIIKYAVPNDGAVQLTVYNALGQVVRTLVNEHQHAGEHTVRWNATNDTGQPVADGLYFYRIVTPNGDMIRKMLLLK